MFEWISDWLGITNLQSRLKAAEHRHAGLMTRIAELEGIVKARTQVGADFGYNRRNNYIVMVGTINGDRDYVQTFMLPGNTFNELHQHLRHLSRNATIRAVDAPPEFRAVRERF
jgi:hypothetical protein